MQLIKAFAIWDKRSSPWFESKTGCAKTHSISRTWNLAIPHQLNEVLQNLALCAIVPDARAQ